MGEAFVTGAQEYLPACVKHYAAYNIENGRALTNSVMDEQTLREKYLRHFEMVIRDTGVACVMAAYNLVNGTKCTQNSHLLNDILREEWNYQGFVMSDWWAMPPGGAFATTDALKEWASQGVNAGMDMELPWCYNYAEIPAITGPLPSFPVTPVQVTESASRILESKFRFNVGNIQSQTNGLQPAATKLDQGTGNIVNNDAHVADAERAALEGSVLLQNNPVQSGGAPILPIDKTKIRTIAVVGGQVPFSVPGTVPPSGTSDFPTEARLGDLGSSRVFSDPTQCDANNLHSGQCSIGPSAGITYAAQAVDPGIKVVGNLHSADEVKTANPDLIVAVVGLTPQDEGEEYTGAGDRTTLDLDGKLATYKPPVPAIQNPLMTALIALGKPIVVIVEAGAPVNMPWLSQVQGVVMAWYPGQHGGLILGQQLFGTANFSGKLPLTWPKTDSDLPQWEGPNLTTTMGFYTGYQYFDQMNIAPLYAFGHGMSYTSFKYSNLYVPCTTVTPNGVVYVTADITNTGTMAGDETAFLFLSFPNHAERRAMKELRGFARVSLMPGETKRVTFPIRVEYLKTWKCDNSSPCAVGDQSGSWMPANGTFNVSVGPSSDNLTLTGGSFVVQ
jgi:beta-glucosidase